MIRTCKKGGNEIGSEPYYEIWFYAKQRRIF